MCSFPLGRVMQRKPSLGKPDQKDLNENLAATQGLAHMIAECKKLFQVKHLFAELMGGILANMAYICCVMES